MHAICQVAIYRRATGQQLKGLASILQRWLEDVPNSCRCSVAGNGIRDLHRGELPTPECRRLDTSRDDHDAAWGAIQSSPSPADRDRRADAKPRDSTGSVVIHIEYGSKSGYGEAIDSLRSSLPAQLVADLSVMEMDWMDDDDQ